MSLGERTELPPFSFFFKLDAHLTVSITTACSSHPNQLQPQLSRQLNRSGAASASSLRMASSSQQSSYAPRSTFSPGAGSKAGLPQFGAAPPVPASAVPTGTLAPGTVVQVGAYTVTVERFLSEGTFELILKNLLEATASQAGTAQLRRS